MGVSGILRDAGHDVVEAADGKEGIEQAQKHRDIKLLISDFNMPHVDGIQMTKAIRSEDPHKNLAVLMLTTESSNTLRTMGKEAGIIAWVTKPYEEEKLANVIAKVLQKVA